MKSYQEYIIDQRGGTMSPNFGEGYVKVFLGLCPNIPFSKSSSLLNVGASNRGLYDVLTSRYEMTQITSIDVCDQALALYQHSDFKLQDIDAHFMHEYFQAKSFDIIYATHSFEHMYDLDKVLQNCHILLKDDSYLLVAVPLPSENWGHGHWVNIPNPIDMINYALTNGFKCLNWHHVNKHGEYLELGVRGEEFIGVFVKIT